MSDHPHTEFLFEIRGEDITPRALSARDLSEFITELEKLLRYLTRSQNIEVKAEQVRASVVAVSEGSIRLTLAPSLPVITLPVAAKMADDLNNNRTEDWPPYAYMALKNIRAAANSLRATASVLVPVNGHVVEASFTEVSSAPHVENLRGLTTIYGRVVRLGGVDPRVDLAPLTGKGILHCEADEALVKSMQDRLYEYVSLDGVAQWDPFSLEMKKFRVMDWRPFANRNPVEALTTLREQFGRYFEDIDDVDAWVRELRNEDGE